MKMKTKNVTKRKTAITASLLALLIFGAGAAFMGCGGGGGSAPDNSAVVVTVGDIDITENKVNAFTELMFFMYGADFSVITDENERDMYRSETLDTMVRAAAMELHFEGKDVLPADMDDRLKQFTDMIDQTPGIRETFEAKGITNDLIRYYLNTQSYFQALAEEVTEGGTLPTEAEIEAYFTEHEQEFSEERRISHILVGSAEHTDEDRQLAEEIREKIASGEESFEDMALEYGQDDTKNTGGDLDYNVKDAYVPEFSEVAFALPLEELSGIVESQFGFHILKVTDIRPVTLDAQRESIRNTLTYEISDKRATELVDEFGVTYPS